MGLFLISVEHVQSEWSKRLETKTQEWQVKLQRNEEFMCLTPHCQQANDRGACERIIKLHTKLCNDGSAEDCYAFAYMYANGDEMRGIKPDIKKAQEYADKVYTMDATFCAYMSGLFMYKDRKIAIKYAEKACEMGELSDCIVATEFYAVGFGVWVKNPQK